MFGDTIAAVSTPYGKGGVALLRISGDAALEVAERVFLPKNGKALSASAPRTAVYGSILSPEADGTRTALDDGIATFFRAPHSFTGEDTVEICCHGGILLTQTVLTAVLSAGARAAEAGEFTKRAFLNGKIGLAAAESLGNMLEAQTKEQLLLAHGAMSGRIEAECKRLYDALCAVLAGIYATIDYPDEDLAEMSREEMRAALSAVLASLEKLCDTYQTGHAIAEGIPTVICGRPNVGKSSLYNRLVGRDAAIVTELAGTTRDVLTAVASVGRVTVRLSDTAGLRETADPVEQIGVQRAKQALDEAELVLAVFDGTVLPDEEDLELMELLRQSSAVKVALLNKADLGTSCDATDFYRAHFDRVIAVSARTGEGRNALFETVEQLFIDGKLDTGADAVLINARQHASALNAVGAVRRALDVLEQGHPIELACSDTEAAMEALAQVDGRAVSEDIVAHIFSHFCVGK